MLLLSLLLALQSPAESGDSWAFRIRSEDPITDLKSAIASVRSEDGKARLTVQCDTVGAPIVSVLYIPEQFTGISGSQRVIFRFDKAAPLEFSAEPISKAKAVTDISDVREIAHLLATSSTGYVRAYDYNDQPVDGRFQVAGGEQQIRNVFAACGISYDKPKKAKR